MTEAMKLETTDEALRNALAWYGEQARLARLIHSEGDPGRWALAEDGGKRAREVLALSASPAGVVKPLQSRVQPWMMACFGPEISADKLERSDRFIEEALELVQSGDYPKERVLALVDYVYGREKGEMQQEVGGVMITLAAFCLAHDIDMHEAGETELARIWTKVEKIRAKQAAKPTGSALPVASRIMSAIEPDGVGVETPPPQTHVTGIAAAQITMGRGLVDVSRIEHEGRAGILFRPREKHIPVGNEGELLAGEYWPVAGDVVIWIENESGAQVIQTYLTPFLSPSPQPRASVSASLKGDEQ